MIKKLTGFRLSSAFCLLLVVMLLYLELTRPSSKWLAFERLEPGMTKTEVEHIMGESQIAFPGGLLGTKLGWLQEATLFSDEYCLEVRLDKRLTVIEKRSYPVAPSYCGELLKHMGL